MLTGFSIETLQIRELKKELLEAIENLKEEQEKLKKEVKELKYIFGGERYNHNVPG